MASGLILLDKPAGMTSRMVDNTLQKLFHTRRVGHLGTLDPFATGLLIVAINEGTKYLPYLPDEEKTYVAKLVLGKKTSTGDLTGETLESTAIPGLNQEQVEGVLRSFLGESTQIPPMTSAIKKDGVALYKLAHKGMEIKREGRKIFIHQIKLISLDKDSLVFEATVSKGTYIRTLGEGIALKLGTLGYLESLRRTKVGDIDVSKAISMEEVDEDKLLDPSLFIGYPRIELNEATYTKAHNGVKLSFDIASPRILLVYNDKPIAIYEREGGTLYRCLRGLA